MLHLPKIYQITNVELSGLSHADQVRILADSGCRFVQIREKSGSSREIYNEVLDALSIASARGMKIIVNDRIDIVLAAGAPGVQCADESASDCVDVPR